MKAGSLGWIFVALLTISTAHGAELSAGFGQTDITPEVGGDKPVYIAGYGMNRKATGVHDPIMARACVLASGDERVAIVGVDLIGLQYPAVKRIRAALPEFRYVLVGSSHNHEGPDVIGIWGRGPFHRGVNDAYLDQVVDGVVSAVRAAEKSLAPVRASFGTAEDETLVGDSRKPYVKDGVLRALKFEKAKGEGMAGIVVQWNCHPESMGPKNKLLTADFCGATVAKLEKEHHCPVVYLTGAIGGLMAPPDGRIHNAQGEELKEGDFEYMRVYGEAVADLTTQALAKAQPIELAPFAVSAKPIAVPVVNPLYRLARAVGVLKRDGFLWTGDYQTLGEPVTKENSDKTTSIESEVAYLRLGELHVACIPGELYPELVYGHFQEPVEPAADFPKAPLEPTVASLMPGPRWMLVGLANDEVGYIIPKRQWDREAPYAYGREYSQYGEINSCGPEVAPIILNALQRRVAEGRAGQRATEEHGKGKASGGR